MMGLPPAAFEVDPPPASVAAKGADGRARGRLLAWLPALPGPVAWLRAAPGLLTWLQVPLVPMAWGLVLSAAGNLALAQGQPDLGYAMAAGEGAARQPSGSPGGYSGGSPGGSAGGSAAAKPLPTLKLSPKARVTPLEAPEARIPLSAIRPFLEYAYILDRDEIEQAPYVVALPERRVMGGTGDRVYVRGLRDGERGPFRLVRPGGPYRDPTSGDILGYQARQVAEVSLERTGDPAVLRVESMSQEIATGDRLVVTSDDEPLLNFTPRPGPAGRQGQIVAVLDGVSQIGSLQVVVIDLGSAAGVEPGHRFDIYNGGEIIHDRVRGEAADWDLRNQRFWSEEFWYGDFRTDRWIRDEPDPNTPLPLHRGASPLGEDFMLPLERAGSLMVFRAFPRLSFALVLEAVRPMHVQDPVLAPAGGG